MTIACTDIWWVQVRRNVTASTYYLWLWVRRLLASYSDTIPCGRVGKNSCLRWSVCDSWTRDMQWNVAFDPAGEYLHQRKISNVCVRAQYTINGVLFAAVAVWFVRAILPAKFSTSVNLSGLSMLAPATGIHTIRCKYNDGSVTMKASTRFFRTNTAWIHGIQHIHGANSAFVELCADILSGFKVPTYRWLCLRGMKRHLKFKGDPHQSRCSQKWMLAVFLAGLADRN